MSYDNQVTLSTTAETAIVAAPGAGTYRHLTYVHVSNATTVSTNITLKNGTGGTTRAVIALPALADGLAAPVELRPPKPLASSSANLTWTAKLGTAATVYVFAQAETSKNATPRADSLP